MKSKFMTDDILMHFLQMSEQLFYDRAIGAVFTPSDFMTGFNYGRCTGQSEAIYRYCISNSQEVVLLVTSEEDKKRVMRRMGEMIGVVDGYNHDVIDMNNRFILPIRDLQKLEQRVKSMTYSKIIFDECALGEVYNAVSFVYKPMVTTIVHVNSRP